MSGVLKTHLRRTPWRLAVLAVLADAITTQLAMSLVGAKEANPIWATLFNEYHMLWPVAIATMLVLTVVANRLLELEPSERMDFYCWTVWVMLLVVYAARIPFVLNNLWVIRQGL